jgi:hypothetical protein
VQDEYNNKTTGKDFISEIARVIRRELISELENAKHVSLLLDGSNDREGVEELILYVRFIKDNRVKEVFFVSYTTTNCNCRWVLESC